MRLRHSLSAIVLLTVASHSRDVAAADERERCATAAEHGQQLRDDGKFRRAREEILICARSVCPGPIKADCSKWLAEIDRDTPTVVFGAKDGAGKDVLDVKVSMDGEPVRTRLDGKPVSVDVGEHTFTFVWPSGVTREERVLVRTGEKSRPITLVESSAPAAAPLPSSSPKSAAPIEPAGPPPETSSKGSLVAPAVAAGIGVVAFASFAFFGLTGKSDLDDLEECKPFCRTDRVDSARTKLTIADVSLATGIVATGVAVYLYLTRPSLGAPEKPARTGVRVDGGTLAGGGFASIGAAF